MTALAPHLSSFLREHLPNERRASQHTCEAYAQAFQLLLCFAARRLKIKPVKIEIERLDAPLVLAFLAHLEGTRGNSARTRNVRLAAINSFFRFLEYRLPSCLDQARRIHAIPMKKTDQALVGYLTRDELQALLNAPDPKTVSGIRDRAMLHLAFAAGLRVSELVGLRLDQIDRPSLSTVHIVGKGRHERVLPLWKQTAAAVKAWLHVRPACNAIELFLNARSQTMTRSGFEYILAKHVAAAAHKVHTLQATRDVRKVSLWLGHASLQSTEVYLRADPTEKLEALAAMTPPLLKPGRFRAPDKLLAMLNTAGRKPSYAE